MGKWCLHASSFIFDQIVIKVAGNQDRHTSSDEFDFGPLVSMAHLYLFWNEIWPWHIGLRWAIVALWATCYYMLGANLGLLLYGEVSVMRNRDFPSRIYLGTDGIQDKRYPEQCLPSKIKGQMEFHTNDIRKRDFPSRIYEQTEFQTNDTLNIDFTS